MQYQAPVRRPQASRAQFAGQRQYVVRTATRNTSVLSALRAVLHTPKRSGLASRA